MALTITERTSNYPPGGGKEMKFEVLFDGSYPTNGETFDMSSYFTAVTVILPQLENSGYMVRHDGGTVAAGKLKVFGSGATNQSIGLEVANATNLSTLTCFVTVCGSAA